MTGHFLQRRTSDLPWKTANMLDTLASTILGSLGAGISLAGVYIAYLQYQQFHARRAYEAPLSMSDIERLRQTQEHPAADPPGVRYRKNHHVAAGAKKLIVSRSAENVVMKSGCACGDVGASSVVALCDPCSFCRESKLRMSPILEAGEATNATDPARAEDQILARPQSTSLFVPDVNRCVDRLLERDESVDEVVFELRSLNVRSTTLP
jgi:hypothetical protein